MIKIIFVCVLVVCISGVHSTRKCGPPCKPCSKTICAADHLLRNCQRLTQCQLDRDNCIRRASNRPTRSNVAGSRCRNLKHPNSNGPCAKVTRPRRSTRVNCNRLKCRNPSKTLGCYRRKNSCQLLNSCQLRRINCQRGRLGPLRVTQAYRCTGMKVGQKLRKCKRRRRG